MKHLTVWHYAIAAVFVLAVWRGLVSAGLTWEAW